MGLDREYQGESEEHQDIDGNVQVHATLEEMDVWLE
jgi:hypothetical protein